MAPSTPPIVAPSILAVAVLVDLLVGEPPRKLHPTAWMGGLIDLLEPRLKLGGPSAERVGGAFLAILLISTFAVPSYLLLSLGKALHLVVYLVMASLLLKSTFAIKSMKDHVAPIIDAVREGSLEDARKKTSLIVSRDTSGLDREEIVSATVESISEGTTDGIVSPIFFFIFGIPVAVAFRVVSTLDSMVGYQDPDHKHFGWFSAKLDTLLNFVPARMTALLIVASAWLLREDWKGAARCVTEDGNKTRSTNAGYPMSAMAGALDVRLEKPGSYVLGGENGPPCIDHVRRALRIMVVSALLFASLIVFLLLSLSLVA